MFSGGNGDGQPRACTRGEVAVRERSDPAPERLGHSGKGLGGRPPGHRLGAGVDRGEANDRIDC